MIEQRVTGHGRLLNHAHLRLSREMRCRKQDLRRTFWVFGGIEPRIDCAGDTEEKERFLRWRAGASGGIRRRECDRSCRGTRVRRMTCIVIGPGGVGRRTWYIQYVCTYVWYVTPRFCIYTYPQVINYCSCCRST